jgi:hypothetical protein
VGFVELEFTLRRAPLYRVLWVVGGVGMVDGVLKVCGGGVVPAFYHQLLILFSSILR